MAVLVIFRAEGASKDLLTRYDRTLGDAVASAPVRPEAHYCVATETGIMIVDVWGSRAELAQSITENDEFQGKWQTAGWPEETVEVFEIHNAGWPG
jgi:hypothetical protein